MPQPNLDDRLHALESDLAYAIANKGRIAAKALENRVTTLLQDIAASPQRAQLAPRLPALISALDALIQTVNNTGRKTTK